jgi:hypothetical protein
MSEDYFKEYPRYAYTFVGLTDSDTYEKDESFPVIDTFSIIYTKSDLYKINTIYELEGALHEEVV